jgi:hypothetical protein
MKSAHDHRRVQLDAHAESLRRAAEQDRLTATALASRRAARTPEKVTLRRPVTLGGTITFVTARLRAALSGSA